MREVIDAAGALGHEIPPSLIDGMIRGTKAVKPYRTSSLIDYQEGREVELEAIWGEEYVGREQIGGMLHYMYHVAFDAKAEIINTVVTEDRALLEANFKGRHIGEFAGLQPTNKEVNVPLCVSYDLENGLVKKARIYMLGDVLMRQLS